MPFRPDILEARTNFAASILRRVVGQVLGAMQQQRSRKKFPLILFTTLVALWVYRTEVSFRRLRVNGNNKFSTSRCSTSADDPEKEICTLSQVCWHAREPESLSIYAPDGLESVLGKRTGPFLQLLFQQGSSSTTWREVSSTASVILQETTVMHMLFQSAWQHVVPDFLSLLTAYWHPEDINATFPARSLFVRQHPTDYDESYIIDLYSVAACKQIDFKISCPKAFAPYFINIDDAFGTSFNKKVWCQFGRCNEENSDSFHVCFDQLVLSIRSGAEWYFDKRHKDILVERILGQRSEESVLCINQRKGSRKFLNIDEISSLMEITFGNRPEILYFENLPFSQQVAAIERCAMFVAPHGAAMTNTIYMKTASAVVEIFPAHYQPVYYYQNAVMSSGLEYYPIVLPTVAVQMSADCTKSFANSSYEACQMDETCRTCFKDGGMEVPIDVLERVFTEITNNGMPHTLGRTTLSKH